MEYQLIHILLLGIAFMILFTAFQTTGLLSQSVLEGMKNETVNGSSFHGSGYISQGIIYICFTIVNIFAPAFITISGPAMAMFLGGITYFCYTLSFISPMTWSYYAASVLVGIGATILWTAQGIYLAVNSDDATVSRNTGIFWALFQVSQIPGNMYAYLSIKTEVIDRTTRYSLFTIFSIVSAIGLLVLIYIVWRSYRERRHNIIPKVYTVNSSVLADVSQTFKTVGQLLKTRNMLLLLIIFIYLGLSPAFIVNVHGTCIGHYMKYGDTRKRLIGLHGILIGAGEIFGGGLFGFVTKPKTSSHKALVIFIGFVLQVIYYYTIFINFSSDAAIHETDLKSYGDFSPKTSQIICFIGSFITGLGDSGLNTQLMNILASHYKQVAGPAFAIFKLVQAFGAAVAFFYAGLLPLQWQLLILVTFLFTGVLGFLSVLFNTTTTEIVTFVTIQEDEKYQSSAISSFG